ncbi:N-acetylneuraminate synthase [Thiomicrorhabdus sp. ZW0627]|uniref:N-acetylneuraminate synthase n=1 Tax=Thiomicrorhabdus sp. ZW0627 TaxID=3039774 RepID=UPI002436B264|nr:N-acetylneuraminate synthase [Thiomicrorhabdus sp. ZW0627]MDG6773362.1 N-acetylneuraminate synthase [Thiomicrorhabdus sp. ZW0627]
MSVFIIAEAGVNHNGSFEMAKQLVDAAVDAGADAVKFQTFKTENLVTETAEQADYQTENTGVKESQFAMLKRLELSEQAHLELFDYCREKGIEFMSTAFDDDSIDFLHELGMKRWKIPSGELLSIPYLRKIAAFDQTTILSTGMGNLDEVGLAIKTLIQAGLSKSNLTVLHANTAYPTPYEDVNLRAMQTLAERFEVSAGLSDHSLGIEVPIAAVALGANVIEKHFTLDKSLPGPDHKASLEPQELKAMVQGIRHIEVALGTGEKIASSSEQANKSVARKRIVASCRIAEGEIFSESNLTLKRSDQGCFAQQWDDLIGQPARKDYEPGEGIDG